MAVQLYVWLLTSSFLSTSIKTVLVTECGSTAVLTVNEDVTALDKFSEITRKQFVTTTVVVYLFQLANQQLGTMKKNGVNA